MLVLFKSISQTVSTVLILLITVVGALITYFWVSSTPSISVGEAVKPFKQMVKVEDVMVENGKLIVVVRNIGDVEITVDRVYIEKAGLTLYSLNVVGGKVKIKPNEVVMVEAELPSEKITGHYTIRICSESGTSATYTTILLARKAKTITWLKGWKYRKPILIVERSGNKLVNYQVKVKLTPENFNYSKARSDGGDLRFTNSNGVTLLPYWVEKWNSGGTSIIWVKIPEIPANGEKKIYLYYGNPEATSKSNGKEVFEFFDDFQELNSNIWGIVSESKAYDVSIISSLEFHDGKGLKVYGWYDTYDFTNVYTKNTWNVPSTGFGYIIETRVSPRTKGLNNYDARLSLYTSNQPVNNHPAWVQGAHIIAVGGGCWGWGCWHWQYDRIRNYTWDNGENKLYWRGEWFIIGIAYYGGNTTYYVWKDNTLYAYKIYSEAHSSFRIILGNHAESISMAPDTTIETWFDWVRFRKYVKPEPSVTVGSEEIQP